MENRNLSAPLIKAGLETHLIGQKILYFPRLSSTMEAARRAIKRGMPEGTGIVAGEQTRGRGRLKRTWISPAGNILMSIVLYPPHATLPYLIMIASLATVQAIESTGLKAQIKWPNDVLVKGKKIAGILVESEMKGTRTGGAIVGIGLNVSLEPGEFAEIAATATSLVNESAVVLRADLVRRLLTEFERFYLMDKVSIFDEWKSHLVTLGKKVTVRSGQESFEGTAESVDESGALLLRLPGGALTRVIAGDVTLREK